MHTYLHRVFLILVVSFERNYKNILYFAAVDKFGANSLILFYFSTSVGPDHVTYRLRGIRESRHCIIYFSHKFVQQTQSCNQTIKASHRFVYRTRKQTSDQFVFTADAMMYLFLLHSQSI